MGTDRPIAVVSSIMVVAFCLAALTSDGAHCSETCAPWGEPHCEETAHFESLEHGAEGGGRSEGRSCVGPMCLCHQHLTHSVYLALDSLPVAEPLDVPRQTLCDLGVVHEILHIPRPPLSA